MRHIETMERRYLMAAAITGFTLINADTDQVIGKLTQDTVINLAELPTRNINIRADATRDTDTVTFRLNGKFLRTEIAEPFAMVSNLHEDYHAWTPQEGQYVLTATAQENSRRSRRSRDSRAATSTLRFTVIDEPTTNPEQPPTQPQNPPTEPEQPPTQPENPPTEPEQPPTQPENPTTPPTEPEQPPTQPELPPTQPQNPTTPPTQPQQPEYPTTPDSKPPIDGNWVLTFVDEFNGSGLSEKWTPQYWWWDGDTGDNGELQRYDKSALTVKDGVLYITATKESGKAKFDKKTYQYKSGLLTTGGSENGHKPGYSFTYGYVEARIKVPAGKGLWSAFWMLPQSYDDGRGEIDIMEVLGDATTTLETHYHVDGPGDADKATKVVDLAADFHTYGVDWQRDSITWYLDGKAVFTAPNKTNEPMYLLLNLAVGGDWPGAPNAQTKFPSSMQVDYVKVWQKQ